MYPQSLTTRSHQNHKEGLKQQLVSQFGHPRGPLGKCIGWLMAIKNRDRIHQVIDKLNIHTQDHILEVGYGPGVAISEAAKRATTGRIVGIDLSTEMYHQAKKRNRPHIHTGRVSLYQGTLQDLPQTLQAFDKALAINTSMFWQNPVADLQIIRERLKRGGHIAIALQPHWAKTEKDLKHEGQEMISQLEAAQFQNVSLTHLPMSSIP